MSGELEPLPGRDLDVLDRSCPVDEPPHERQLGVACSMDRPMTLVTNADQVADVTCASRLEPHRGDVVSMQPPPAARAGLAAVVVVPVNFRRLARRPGGDRRSFRRHASAPEVASGATPRPPDRLEVLRGVAQVRAVTRLALVPCLVPALGRLEREVVALQPLAHRVIAATGPIGDLLDGETLRRDAPPTTRNPCEPEHR